MNGMDGTEVTTFRTPGIVIPVRRTVVCISRQTGRRFSSDVDLNIWIAAHIDARHGG
jgi:hypothetical protein